MKSSVSVYFAYNVTEAPYGGANSFIKTLKNGYQTKPGYGVSPVDDFLKADIIFINAASCGPLLRKCFSFRRFKFVEALSEEMLLPQKLKELSQNLKVPIVQRLDGITKDYGRSDGSGFDQMQVKLNSYAEMTIFQSTYCRDIFLPLLKPHIPCEVIPNGVNGDIFSWKERKKTNGRIKILAASWSSNLKKGYNHLLTLAEFQNVELTFVGRWPNQIPKGRIFVIPEVRQIKLAQLMSENDLFVHFSENDNAPNVVSEALATGMPVLYFLSGGTPEIVQGSRFGEPIKLLSKENIKNALDSIILRYDSLIDEISKSREEFLIENTMSRYSEIFHRYAPLRKKE